MATRISTAEAEWLRYRDAHTANNPRRQLRKREFLHGFYTALESMQGAVDKGWSADSVLIRMRGES